ncbi:MAG TPA: nucleotide exchange factor GrpE [Verrucomicrobiae bacterium]|nr:nucleotide exchange factor GrpE [Verrucomicrobiae bacterium]
MRDQKDLTLPKWMFFLGDLLLLAAAGLICWKSPSPLGAWQCALIVVSVAGAAVLGVLPFVLEYQTVSKLAQSEALTGVVNQIKNVEALAEQIAGATGRWQSVQEVAERVAGTSRAIAERMSAEAKAFTEFMQRANDNEKATLRLETEKLRRAEGEWMQVMVRMLDHVYALHLAGMRSGQQKLIGQLDQFQNACRDAARRIGLTPFVAIRDEQFDEQRHQVFDGQQPSAEGATVAETVATGYTFQGKLIRPALVRLQSTNGNGGVSDPANGEAAAKPAQPEEKPAQPQAG